MIRKILQILGCLLGGTACLGTVYLGGKYAPREAYDSMGFGMGVVGLAGIILLIMGVSGTIALFRESK